MQENRKGDRVVEVSDEQVLGASASLAMLSPVVEDTDKYELQNNVQLTKMSKDELKK